MRLQSVTRGSRAIGRALGVSHVTALRWHRAGLLPSMLAAGRLTMPAAVLDLYLVALSRQAHAALAPLPNVDAPAAARTLARMVRRINSRNRLRVSTYSGGRNENHSHPAPAGGVGGVMSCGPASGARPPDDKKIPPKGLA